MSSIVCNRCRSNAVVNGTCTNCGFIQKKPAPNSLPIGHLLCSGRYRIERTLGGGGYGITYEATDLQKNQRIAIKEFFPSYAFLRTPGSTAVFCKDRSMEPALAHARVRFNQEASLLIALKNVKEIVTVHHSFEDNNTAYYTMDLLQGMDMQKRLQLKGCMSWRELSPIVIKILQALYATHQMGYIHRDVTPDNIFLLNNGTVQLIDFGNARRYGQNLQLTAVVKDKFAPREQYNRQGKQGPWSDIYSLCVTIYYAMTGVLPKKATERNPAEDRLPPLHTVADAPVGVSKAIQIGMAADEAKRYKSIADFAYALYPDQALFGTAQRQLSAQKQAPPASPPTLLCTQGIMKGARLVLTPGVVLTIGRGPGKTIQYPDSCRGISRSQCCILLQGNGVVCIRDEGSTFGTMINGQKLSPGIVWKPLQRSDVISFGQEMYVLC